MTLVKRGMNVFRRILLMHLLIVPKSSFVHNMPMSATATQSLRLIVIPTLLSCCLPANMPNHMMMTLKGVAESMIALMTMLLQILISQLEVSNSCEMLEESNEANPEMRQALENMVQELQNHRNILQGLQMANQQALQNQVARPTSGQASGSNSTPAPGGSGVSRGQGTRPPHPLPNVNLQALALQPMGHPVSPTGTMTMPRGFWPRKKAHRGAHQCDECPDFYDHNSRNDSTKANVHHRAGSEGHHLGSEAQGQDVVGSVSERHRLLPLVSGSLWKPSARSTRVCSFLPDANRSRGSSQWSVSQSSSHDVNQLNDGVFDQEVNQVRDLISKPFKPDDYSSISEVSLKKAESIMEEVYSSATSPRLKSSVFLLEVYGGANSPLTDLAQRMNLKVLRFTREDGNLATPWGRKKLWEWIDKYNLK